MGDSKRRSVEFERGWSNELVYQLLENVKEYAITATNVDGEIAAWNLGAEKIFGYTPDEAIGQDAAILFTDEDRAKRVPEEEMRISLDRGYAEDERWHVRKDGTPFFASGIMSPLFKDGVHAGYAKIARDLTDRIIAHEALRRAHEAVDAKVEEETGELRHSYEALQKEIIESSEAEKLRAALIRRIVRAQEDERKRIAREIHDNVGQRMTALQLNLKMLLVRFAHDAPVFDELNRLNSITNDVDADVDFLTWELRPSVLDDLGLEPASERYIREWSSHFNIPAEFASVQTNGKRFLPEIEINLYRLLQEALNNVAKHAKATKVNVLLEHLDNRLSLIIEDNGIGFDVDEKFQKRADDRGLGLIGMRERADFIGGNLDIESELGTGTTVFARVVTAELNGSISEN